MSRENPDSAEPGQARQYRAPAGLLEKLMAAVRPEFRASDLVFDPRDPVFGGPPCAVSGCDRPQRGHGLCTSHWQRWRGSRGVSLAEFTATAEPGWHGHLPLDSCVIDGCNYGVMGRGMCNRHFSRWYRAGCPDPERWQAQAPPLAPDGPLRTCRIGYCSLWARGTSVFCYGHDTRWKNNGRPGIDQFAASCENPGPGQEHIDLRRLPAGLRLEMQYVLQCRGDERDAKLPPRDLHPFVASWPARARLPCWNSPKNGGFPSIRRGGGAAGARSSSMRAAASRRSRSAPAGTPSTPGTSGGCATWASTSPRPPSASRGSPRTGCGSWPSDTPAGSWPPACPSPRPGPGSGP